MLDFRKLLVEKDVVNVREDIKKVVENMLPLSHILGLQHYNTKIHLLRKLKINY